MYYSKVTSLLHHLLCFAFFSYIIHEVTGILVVLRLTRFSEYLDRDNNDDYYNHYYYFYHLN